MAAGKKLIPLEMHNSYVEFLDSWEPYPGNKTGFSCPKCKKELSFAPGAYWKREGGFLQKRCICDGSDDDGCGWTGDLRALPIPHLG